MSEKIDNIKKILDNSSYFYKKDNIYVDKRTEDYAEIIEFDLSFYFSNALIPGKFFPSKLSNIAPPPVET